MILHKKKEHAHVICCDMLRNMNKRKHVKERNVWPHNYRMKIKILFNCISNQQRERLTHSSSGRGQFIWEGTDKQMQKNQPKKGRKVVLVPLHRRSTRLHLQYNAKTYMA